MTSKERYLLALINRTKSLFHKYNEDTEYHHVVYHTLLRLFVIFRQGNSSNSEYKHIFKEKIMVLETYNGGGLFGNSPGSMAREIKLLELDTKIKDNVEKAQTSARGKYLATVFLLSLDMRRYGELIMALKNNYVKQQGTYPKTLSDMYGMMVTFGPTSSAVVTRGHNERLIFRNVATNSKAAGTGDVGSGGNGAGRKIECCN